MKRCEAVREEDRAMGYPSHVSDREWAEIERFFEPEHIGRPRKHSARSLYNANPARGARWLPMADVAEGFSTLARGVHDLLALA